MYSFAALPIIDCHFHTHMRIDEVDKANMYMSRDDESKASVMDLMDSCDLEAINLVSSTGSVVGKEHMNENLVTALFKFLYPERIYAFGGLHHYWPGVSQDQLDYAGQAKKLRDLGFDGIKMIEGKPTVRKALGRPLDSPDFDAYYAFLEAEQFPLLLHVGDPEGFWNPGAMYSDPSFVEREALYREAEGILTKFPRIKIIFAHFYFMASDIDRASGFLDKWPDVSFDLTPGPSMYGYFSQAPEKWRSFFIKYQDRILLGTDNHAEKRNFGPEAPAEYWPTPKIYAMRTFLETDREFRGWHRDLKGICLEKEVLEKIYCRNFQRYAGENPRKLNTEFAIHECKHLMDMASKNSVTHDVFSQMQEFLNRIVERG